MVALFEYKKVVVIVKVSWTERELVNMKYLKLTSPMMTLNAGRVVC